MAGVDAPWWIGGGWAIDLFLGRTHRPHSDLDAGCFRRDLSTMLRHFGSWEICVVAGGSLTRLPAGGLPDAAVHGLWCRPIGSECWVLEILIEDSEFGDWVYRRDRRVRRPAEAIIGRSAAGTPYLQPEVQLLYKSKAPRACDQEDFQAAWPSLSHDAKVWLAASLRTTDPGHEWLTLLMEDGNSGRMPRGRPTRG